MRLDGTGRLIVRQLPARACRGLSRQPHQAGGRTSNIFRALPMAPARISPGACPRASESAFPTELDCPAQQPIPLHARHHSRFSSISPTSQSWFLLCPTEMYPIARAKAAQTCPKAPQQPHNLHILARQPAAPSLPPANQHAWRRYESPGMLRVLEPRNDLTAKQSSRAVRTPYC